MTYRIALLCLSAALTIGCATSKPLPARAPEHAARVYRDATEAAEALLELMDMQTILAQSTDQMLDLQIKQNPALAPLRSTMRKFMDTYVSWSALKQDIIAMYAEAFDKAELEQMIVYYRSDVGQKSVKTMPELMKKGAALGAKRVEENLPELQKMLMDALQEINDEPPRTP